ncbi:MAG: O-antigen ligase family protein [Parvibaculum sedimenti]|uniref:O-antigen ligase family protein n=1 Tax=Parvibaculum sedimenti TaxID=2608632 RepID=UPI003BB5EFFE
MTYLLPLGLLTLFTALKFHVGVVQLRPFDAVVVLMIGWVLVNGASFGQKRMVGFLMLLPFFLWHVLSALLGGADNGLREGLQVSLMIAFATTIVLSLDLIDYKTAARVMIAGLVVVLAYNVIWHVSQGMWVGWKRLNNPKAVFDFLPMALGCLVLFAAPAQRRLYWLVWIGLLVLIVLSTERKALIIYGVITAILLARGRMLAALPLVGVGIIGLFIVINLFAAESFTRHLRALTDPIESAGSAAMVARGVTPESLSNAQRKFAFNVATTYFSQSPLIGIGTNEYANRVREQYGYLPAYMLLGIHGEFLRVATENGLVGLIFYVAIWLSSVVRLRRVLFFFLRRRQITRPQAAVTPFLLLTAPLMYLGFEASGTPSFTVLIIVSLMPELTYSALRQRATAMEAARERRRRSDVNFGSDQLVAG